MFYTILFLFLLSSIHSIPSYLLNISLAISNTPTVIACGLSIDIYPSFDPAQVIICPYVLIEKNRIQLIYMNISSEDQNQITIYSNPPIITPPKFLIKLNNHSFISPLHLNRNSTYYLSFSSELTCRFSLMNNETICFYYPISSNFFRIEYHYDEIKQGSLILSDQSRNRFYIIFIIITIFIILISLIGIYIVCTNRISLRYVTEFDLIIDKQVARQDAARRPPDPPQPDGGVGHPVLPDIKETHGVTGDL